MGFKSAALAGVALLSIAQYAQAQNFNQMIAFGDSTTDTGWFARAPTGSSFAALIFDGFIRNSLAAGGNAHFTGPGPGNAQILGSFFGLAANPANSPGGTNYAIGGAFDGATLGPGFQNLFSTTYGVANPNLPGTAAQIGNYLASVNGRANPNALYLISSGGNDAFYASSTFGSNAAAANVFLLSEAQALVAAGAQLQQAGARFIIVSDEYQPPSADANAAIYGRTVFTATWAGLAAAGVKFIPADTASVIAAVEAKSVPVRNHRADNILRLHSSGPVPGQRLRRYLCTDYDAEQHAPYGYLVSADATQTHLFMDGTHLTEAGQLIIADYYLQPAGRTERDIVPGRNRHPNDVPDHQRHPAADRSGGAISCTRLERLVQRRHRLFQVPEQLRGISRAILRCRSPARWASTTSGRTAGSPAPRSPPAMPIRHSRWAGASRRTWVR